MSESPQFRLAGDYSAEMVADATARKQRLDEGIPLGPKTSIPSLDEVFDGGLWPGSHVLVGPPGGGKTTLCVQMAIRCGIPALYVSLEMSARQILRRAMAHVTGHFVSRYRREPNPDTVTEHMAQLAKVAPWFAVTEDAASSISQARELKAAAKAPHVLLIVDSLQIFASLTSDLPSEYEQVSETMQKFRVLGDDDFVTILLSQTNRLGRSMSGGTSMESAAGGHKIEHLAETYIGLRPGEATIDVPDHADVVMVDVRKNREGRTADEQNAIPLLMYGGEVKFVEPTEHLADSLRRQQGTRKKEKKGGAL